MNTAKKRIVVSRSALFRRLSGREKELGLLLSKAVELGDNKIELDDLDFQAVFSPITKENAKKARGIAGFKPQISEPTAIELAANFAGAMSRWAAAGFATVSGEQYAARSAVCDGCEMWDGSARLGLGKCNAPGCGCTSMKRWLASERCPLDKWPKV